MSPINRASAIMGPVDRASMRHVQDRIASALGAWGVAATDAVGIACSGGPDSAVLAHAAMALSRQRRLGAITLLHVDHGLRPDSANDGKLVAELARSGGGTVVILAAAVDRSRASLEAAAREARYTAIERAATELALRWVLLAHTASDQAETVLMRIIRGTGIVGLSAIPPQRGMYLRPLLDTTRHEIEQYRAAFAVPAVTDPTNRDPRFFRNRVRHHWLPALDQENPRIADALCRLADAARQEREVLAYAAQQLLARTLRQPDDKPHQRSDARAAATPVPDAGGTDVAETGVRLLHIGTLQQAPVAVMRAALALAAESLGGGPLQASHQRALHDLLRRPAAGTVELSLPGLVAVREYDLLHLVRREVRRGVRRKARCGRDDQRPEPPTRPGAGDCPGSDQATATSRATPNPHPANPGTSVAVHGPDGPYTIRRWQPGDRMRPARLKGRSRKLSDLFVDAKIPRRQRVTALVVTRQSDGVIEWAQYIGPAYCSPISVTLTITRPVTSNKVSD